jgi:geranylgeranyl diphosphate synthase type II
VQNYTHLLTYLNQKIISQCTELNSLSPSNMYAPMSYILNLGGKRIRPLLTLFGCDLFNGKPEDAIHAAISVELFHNFSLIHDDILDNAPLRRGSATVHEKWNSNIAILSGDGMMVKAFEELSKSNQKHIASLLQLFSKTSIQICEGQQLDMDFENQEKVSVDNYIQMITYKTAVLLGCSLQMGAICANASANNQNHIYEFGKHVGIAFQILDDVLDVYADNQLFGKQIGGDIISNKKTFLLLKAFELANKEQLNLLNELLQNKEIQNSKKVEQVKLLYDTLKIKSIALTEANKHTEIALNHLNEIDVELQKKNDLKDFALQLLNREM